MRRRGSRSSRAGWRERSHIGINWTSGLEVAIRSLSWCWACALFEGSPSLHSGRRRRKILGSLSEHAAVHRKAPVLLLQPLQPSHWRGDGAFRLGRLVPWLRPSAHWRERGWAILKKKCRGSITRREARSNKPPGITISRSGSICRPCSPGAADRRWRRPEDVVRPGKSHRVLHAHDAARWIDADDRRWRRRQGGFRCYRPTSGTSGCFSVWARPCSAEAISRKWEAAPRQTPYGAGREWTGVRTTPSESSFRRTRRGDCREWLLHHALGMGSGRALPGVRLRRAWRQGCRRRNAVGGARPRRYPVDRGLGVRQPLLVDPGFWTYNGSAEWHRYFRETEAHNTVVVDGRSQAEFRGPAEVVACAQGGRA